MAQLYSTLWPLTNNYLFSVHMYNRTFCGTPKYACPGESGQAALFLLSNQGVVPAASHWRVGSSQDCSMLRCNPWVCPYLKCAGELTGETHDGRCSVGQSLMNRRARRDKKWIDELHYICKFIQGLECNCKNENEYNYKNDIEINYPYEILETYVRWNVMTQTWWGKLCSNLIYSRDLSPDWVEKWLSRRWCAQ